MKLNYDDWSEEVQSMMKFRQDHNMTYCIGVVYAKIGTKL